MQLVRDRLTWITYAQIAVWCYFLYGFQPVVPLLREEQETSRAVASLHGTAFAIGGILGGALLPWMTRRLGRQRLVWLGLGMVSVSAVALLSAHAIALTVGFVAFASLGAAFLINAVVATLTDHHGPAGPAAISEANALAAAVGLVAPLVVGGAVALGLGWRLGLVVVVLLIAALALVAWSLGVRAPEPKPVSTPGDRRHAPLPRTYWLVFASLFATGSVEVCINLWSADVLRERAGVSPGVATAALSTMLAGMLIGRFAGGRLLLRHRGTTVLLGALAVSLAGFAVFWLAATPWVAFAGLALTGLGISLHYPLGIGLAVTHSGGQPDLAAARASYSVGTSFAVGPFVLGAVADRIGPHPAFLVVPVFIAASAAAIVLLARADRRSEAAGDGDAVGEREQDGVDPGVGVDQVVEGRDGLGVVVVRRGVDDPPVP